MANCYCLGRESSILCFPSKRRLNHIYTDFKVTVSYSKLFSSILWVSFVDFLRLKQNNTLVHWSIVNCDPRAQHLYFSMICFNLTKALKVSALKNVRPFLICLVRHALVSHSYACYRITSFTNFPDKSCNIIILQHLISDPAAYLILCH